MNGFFIFCIEGYFLFLLTNLYEINKKTSQTGINSTEIFKPVNHMITNIPIKKIRQM